MLVDVERSDPTVNCDVVAIKFAPVASETMMELFGYDVWFVPPRATVTVGRVTALVPRVYVSPVPKVVVAELNCENLDVERHPKTDTEAVSQVTAPAEYERPVEKVVVAVQVGTPLTRARMKPFVVFEIDERLLAAVV